MNTYTQLIQQCSDRNCSDCRSDIYKCNECIDEYYLDTFGHCNAARYIQPGMGYDHFRKTVVKCADSHCYNCSLKHDVCKSCKFNYSLTENNRCEFKPVIPANNTQNNTNSSHNQTNSSHNQTQNQTNKTNTTQN